MKTTYSLNKTTQDKKPIYRVSYTQGGLSRIQLSINSVCRVEKCFAVYTKKLFSCQNYHLYTIAGRKLEFSDPITLESINALNKKKNMYLCRWLIFKSF